MGGAERVFLSLLEGLDRARFEVVAAYHGAGTLSAEFQRYARGRGSFNLLRFWDPRTIVALARHMRQIRCDIVHSHLWTADVLTGYAAALARVPLRIATVHGRYFQYDDATLTQRLRRAPASRVYRAIYAAFDKVIAVSEAVRRDLSSRPGVRVPERKIEVIRDGLDMARMNRSGEGSTELAARLGVRVPQRVPVITTVANFAPIKGHRWLVRAMPLVLRQVPNAMFVLHGSGTARATVEGWVREANLAGHVVFSEQPGVASRDILAISDVVVVPSLSEGFGLVILEACALAKPVVATAVGGIPEILDDHRTGLLVPPRDPGALAAAIVSVLGDPSLAQRLGEAGRRHVHSEFPVARMLRATETLYSRAV